MVEFETGKQWNRPVFGNLAIIHNLLVLYWFTAKRWYPCNIQHKHRSDKPRQHVTCKRWIWRDVRKAVIKMMLVSFRSPKCNHNKLPLWGTDTFDLYFFMIHVCIYCCAVAHMDNTVPHVWISLNNNRRLNSFLKLLLSLCTVFVSVAFFNMFMHRSPDKLIYSTYAFTNKAELFNFVVPSTIDSVQLLLGLVGPSSGPSPFRSDCSVGFCCFTKIFTQMNITMTEHDLSLSLFYQWYSVIFCALQNTRKLRTSYRNTFPLPSIPQARSILKCSRWMADVPVRKRKKARHALTSSSSVEAPKDRRPIESLWH